MDGDGDVDLIVANGGGTGQENRYYLNNGSGTFTDVTNALMPDAEDRSRAVALGDTDGDGDLDLVVGNGGPPAQQNRLYLNDGSGQLSDTTATRIPEDEGSNDVVLGDVDGDGDLDLVFGNGWPGTGELNRLYLNNGAGIFTDVTAAKMPAIVAVTFDAALGDVDADGDLDLLLGNDGQNELYLNNGSGTFTDVTAARMPALAQTTSSLALGDVDADGDLDLVVGNVLAQRENRLHLNDGAGTFTDAPGRMPTDLDHTAGVTLGDVDADGDLDLVEADENRTRLFLNLLRQLDAPLLLRVGHAYPLEVYARYGPAGPGDYAFVLLAAGTANIPLAPFGTLFLDPATLVALPRLNIPQPAGVVSVSLQVPNVPSIAGLSLYGQALIVQQQGARLTNFTADVVIR